MALDNHEAPQPWDKDISSSCTLMCPPPSPLKTATFTTLSPKQRTQIGREQSTLAWRHLHCRVFDTMGLRRAMSAGALVPSSPLPLVSSSPDVFQFHRSSWHPSDNTILLHLKRRFQKCVLFCCFIIFTTKNTWSPSGNIPIAIHVPENVMEHRNNVTQALRYEWPHRGTKAQLLSDRSKIMWPELNWKSFKLFTK